MSDMAQSEKKMTEMIIETAGKLRNVVGDYIADASQIGTSTGESVEDALKKRPSTPAPGGGGGGDSKSNWAGKKVLLMGDSLVDFGKIGNWLEKILGCKVYNRGQSGSRIANSSGTDSDITADAPSFCTRIDLPTSDSDSHAAGLPTSVDLIIMIGGINDWGEVRRQKFGKLEDGPNDTTSFYGALHYVISKLKNKYPSAQFVIANLHSPHNKPGGWFANWDEYQYNTDVDDISGGFTIKKNEVGKTLEDYRSAIRQVGAFYGCNVVELKNCGITFHTVENRNLLSKDGLHPSELGDKKIAEYIISRLSFNSEATLP